jgi:hypothetical protein
LPPSEFLTSKERLGHAQLAILSRSFDAAKLN